DLLRRTSYLKNVEPLDAKIEVSVGKRTEDVLLASMDKGKMLLLLSDCLGRLDEVHLSIFKLRWKGLKSAQICNALSIDPMEMRRCYDRIKKTLEVCMQTKGLTVTIDQIILLGELDE